MIKQLTEKVIKYSQGFSEDTKINIDKVMNNWWSSKVLRFAPIFNEANNYILEYPEPIEIQLSSDIKEDLLDSVIQSIPLSDLREFVYHQGVEGLFSNTVITNNGYEKIPKGMKLLKAMKFFIEDKETLNIYQSIASEAIQKGKIKGRLCLSIHPLDFLSISENTYNWRSCHALNGEYRMGNISYIQDPSTIVAYIKGEEDKKLPHFPEEVPWNSKKWRVLLHISEEGDLMFASKQYPFDSPEALKLVKDFVDSSGLINDANCQLNGQYTIPYDSVNIELSEWCDDYISEATRFGESANYFDQSKRYILNDLGEIVPLKHYIQQDDGALNYNDVLYSTVYRKPFYAFTHRKLNSFQNIPYHFSPIKIGADTRCVCCASNYPEEESMICTECDSKISYNNGSWRCTECGQRFSREDVDYIEVNGDKICDYCWDEYYQECEYCGQRGRYDDWDWVRLDDDYLTFCCEECLEKYLEEKERDK